MWKNISRNIGRIQTLVAYGATVQEIRKALLDDGLTEEEAFFAFAAAKVMK